MSFVKTILQAALLAASFNIALAIPATPKVTDTDILNYALTLEHLEDAFYQLALQKFSAQDFTSAGYSDEVFGRIKQVSAHERAHVQLLQAALGEHAVKPCEYNFPITTIQDFVNLAVIYENVGTSAYSGAVPWLSDFSTALVGEAILTTEANHGTFIGTAVAKINPWSGKLGTPLPPQAVLTLASPFIVSCPSTNAPSPFSPLPLLKMTNTPDAPLTLHLDFNIPQGHENTPMFFVLIQGFEFKAIPITNKQAILPDTVLNDGNLFGFVSTQQAYPSATLQEIVAGPLLLNFPYGADIDDVVYGFPN